MYLLTYLLTYEDENSIKLLYNEIGCVRRKSASNFCNINGQ